MKIHEIKKGDTWESIAEKYFGTSSGMAKLADYNGYEGSSHLAAGDLLKIPPTLHIR
jgi:nucleoid-associated protein YgaU